MDAILRKIGGIIALICFPFLTTVGCSKINANPVSQGWNNQPNAGSDRQSEPILSEGDSLSVTQLSSQKLHLCWK